MKVNGQDAWIIASLSVVTSDLPQGNNMVRVLRHNANRGCKTCTISKDSLIDKLKIYQKYQDIIILLIMNLMKY